MRTIAVPVPASGPARYVLAAGEAWTPNLVSWRQLVGAPVDDTTPAFPLLRMYAPDGSEIATFEAPALTTLNGEPPPVYTHDTFSQQADATGQSGGYTVDDDAGDPFTYYPDDFAWVANIAGNWRVQLDGTFQVASPDGDPSQLYTASFSPGATTVETFEEIPGDDPPNLYGFALDFHTYFDTHHTIGLGADARNAFGAAVLTLDADVTMTYLDGVSNAPCVITYSAGQLAATAPDPVDPSGADLSVRSTMAAVNLIPGCAVEIGTYDKLGAARSQDAVIEATFVVDDLAAEAEE